MHFFLIGMILFTSCDHLCSVLPCSTPCNMVFKDTNGSPPSQTPLSKLNSLVRFYFLRSQKRLLVCSWQPLLSLLPLELFLTQFPKDKIGQSDVFVFPAICPKASTHTSPPLPSKTHTPSQGRMQTCHSGIKISLWPAGKSPAFSNFS